MNDPLVLEELDRRVEDQYQTELQQHANLRTKAREVIEAALDEGSLKAALAILRLGPRAADRAPVEKEAGALTANFFGTAQHHSPAEHLDLLTAPSQAVSPAEEQRVLQTT